MFFSHLRMCVCLEPSQSRKCRSDAADVQCQEQAQKLMNSGQQIFKSFTAIH